MSKKPAFSASVECAILAICCASVVLFAGAVTWANTHNVNIAAQSGDEYDFTWILEYMYGGLITLHPRDFFKIVFYNYGFPYFFLELVLTIPALVMRSYDAMLIIERCFSLAWAISLLALSGWWVRRRTGSWAWALMVVWLLIAMPGFVNMTTIAHPDTMMNFFLLAAFVAAAELDPSRWRDVAIVGVLCGLGACAKIQIALYVPFVAGLFGWRAWLTNGGLSDRLIRTMGVSAVVGFLMPVTYLALNPFLLNATARYHFVLLFKENLESNATNHFSYVLPTIADKLGMLSHYYFSAALVGLVTAATLAAAAYRKLRLTNIASELMILGCGIITGLYIFLTVQKTWDSYYLPTFTLLAVSLVMLWGRIASRDGALNRGGLATVLVMALALIAARTPAAVAARIVDDGPRMRAMAPLDFLMSSVMKRTTGKRVLTSPGVHFQFQNLGLRFTQVTFIPGIPGALNEERLDTADVLVLEKNDAYFDAMQLNQPGSQGALVRQARRRIDTMRAGRDTEFLVCAENMTTVIFCRRSVYLVFGS